MNKKKPRMFKLNQSRRRVGRVGQLVPRTALLRMQREPAGDDRACNRKFTSYPRGVERRDSDGARRATSGWSGS